MQVTYFLNGPISNLLFYCQIILYWEKVTSYEKFSHNLTLEVQICLENFSVLMLQMEVSKCWKMLEFQKIPIKMKNSETFYEAQTASCLREIIQPSPNPQPTSHQIKSYYVFGAKIFLRRYTDMYRHLLSKCFKNAVLWCQEMVQPKCFFWHQTETYLLENL